MPTAGTPPTKANSKPKGGRKRGGSKPETVQEEFNRPDLVTIEVPLGERDPAQYCARRVNTLFTPQEAQTLRELVIALNETNARLENGRHVGDSPAFALRWLICQVREAMGAS